jgi:glycosyltransferase involved in cell wall biosynthesis
MGRPLVSVVVPNYNHARFLERRVASVLEQTVQDLEIILLDDASTDNSTAILDSCRKDPRVRCHFNEANSGSPFAQWNRGIAMATGEFLWIAESDDDAEPRLLEGLLPLFQDGVDVAYCASRLMGEDGALFGTIPDPSRSPSQSRFAAPFCRSGTDELFDQLAAVCNEIPNASGVLFRLSALRAAGEADASYGLMGDWQYYARILLRGPRGMEPVPRHLALRP